MTIRRTLARTALLASALLLAACNSGNDTTGNGAASASPSTASPTAASSATPADASTGAATSTTTDAADASRPPPPVGFPPGPTPQEGKDYALIDTPDLPTGDKVQVTEVFGYGCPHCNALQPHLAAWEKKLPTDVQFNYMPAAFGPGPAHCWDEFARGFYAMQAMGVPIAKFHDGVYKAVWAGAGFTGDCSIVPKAFASFGVDPQAFSATAQSFAVTAKVGQAHDQILRWGIDSTPTVIIDGKYRVLEQVDSGPDGMLHTIDWLIAKQRPLHGKH